VARGPSLTERRKKEDAPLPVVKEQHELA